jgi:hypothetical protein
VGIDAKKNVLDELELKVNDDIFPRDVQGHSCKGAIISIQVSDGKKPKFLKYKWDGKRLNTMK